jgi:RNA polymerase sigma-70 factor, ECF subfamily
MKEKYEFAFMTHKNELSSFVFRLLTNRQDTEDVVQDTFVKGFNSIDSFQGKSTLKTWMFTIALNTAKNHLKGKKRWLENTQDHGADLHSKSPELVDKMSVVFNATPEKDYEIKEHINYCFNCINKTLLLKQQICLLLKEVYSFKISEIIEITSFTEGVVKHSLADARKNMIRIFNNRCAFVNKKGVCHQCTVLKGVLNPKQDAHIKAQEVKMVKEGSSTNAEYLLNLRLELVRGIDPLNDKNTILNTYMLEKSEEWVAKGIAKNGEEYSPKPDCYT